VDTLDSWRVKGLRIGEEIRSSQPGSTFKKGISDTVSRLMYTPRSAMTFASNLRCLRTNSMGVHRESTDRPSKAVKVGQNTILGLRQHEAIKESADVRCIH
jgi:hypothetical protein